MVVLGTQHCGGSLGDTGSYKLRVAGLFAIMGGSAIMIALPLLLKERCKWLLQLGTAFACGIVLATAFVHILPDAGRRACRCSGCLAQRLALLCNMRQGAAAYL